MAPSEQTTPTRESRGAADLEGRFRAIAAEYRGALERLARGYERDDDRQHDLVQEILVAIWRALPAFEGRSSVRTWVYRIAHNVAVTHVVTRSRDRLARSVSLEALGDAAGHDLLSELEGRDAVARVASLVRSLRPADAQVILLYLEGLEHAEIAEVTGLTEGNVAVKAHRIKAVLKAALEKERRT